MEVEKELETMNFSRFSKIKDQLEKKLVEESRFLYKEELELDELDEVIAARGNVTPKPKKEV